MKLDEWAALKKVSLRQLGPVDVRNVTPSLRDFTTAVSTQKQALAVILDLSLSLPESLAPAPALMDLQTAVRIADDASVSVIATGADAATGSERWQDVQQVARTSPNPVLCRDLFLVREQVYQARLAGADAIHLQASVLSAPELKTFIDIASSTHMAAAVEVEDEAQLQSTLAAGARICVLPAWGTDGGLSVERVLHLAKSAPRTTTLIARGPFGNPASLAHVQSHVDAVWIATPFYWSPEGAEDLRAFVDAAENG